MWWLIVGCIVSHTVVGDVVAHCGRCGGSLAGDVVAHAVVGDVVAHT